MSETNIWCKDKSRLDTGDKRVFSVNRLGTKLWYFNGVRHRENAPAVEYANGNKWWFMNGKYYSESDYWKVLNK